MIFLALCLFIVNMIVFVIQKSTQSINQTAIIVIVSVVAGVLGIPILGFLIFHLYLTVTKKTTRELLKHIDRDEEEFENQWCSVDPPVMDLFDDITEEQAESIKLRLEEISKPVVQAVSVPLESNPVGGELMQHELMANNTSLN
jgi:amino acid permease